jgi:hydrogenase maturation protein HypF
MSGSCPSMTQTSGNGRVAQRITVRGVVQGVGFRPFVYRLAQAHGLAGWVLNHSGGVEIEVEGPPAALTSFVYDLEQQAPPQAHIAELQVTDVPISGHPAFAIRHSVAAEGLYQLVSPDVATCPDCLRELLDPADRRYRYPFTNCTNCGPRFTIIADMPYDRPLTTMRDFTMCPQCQAEYDDPLNRRFHAQPNACPVCGPRLWLEPETQRLADEEDAVAQAARLLQDGAILALKGLGGFHLACDATNAQTVQTLRARKHRPDKPLAVMMATVEAVAEQCDVSEAERQVLTSSQRPIVLLRRKPGASVVPQVSQDPLTLGVMLPYTPLHHLLLRDVGRPLVMTSGNLAEEPLVCTNDEARQRLAHLADVFLMHDRDIFARCDDSVWFAPAAGPRSRPQPIRRARGYAPLPVPLPFHVRQVLACGAEKKNTFCLTRDTYAFLSPHIGDMENLDTLEHFEAMVERYQHLFHSTPEVIAHDMHPDYLATQYARRRQASGRALLQPVQHHHAHIASCLADNAYPADAGPVIGVAWDGTGYGVDGAIWGGEFLLADYRGFRRAAHLEYLPMPGGEAAIRDPRRLALGYLYALTGSLPPAPALDVGEEARRIILQQLDRRLNCPLTSAGGRLFDAVAALLGVCGRVSYEGQAAVALELAAAAYPTDPEAGPAGYPFHLDAGTDGAKIIRLRPLFEGLLADLHAGAPTDKLAYRFHVTAAEIIGATCAGLAEATGVHTVALSGGCFQNRLLLALVFSRLQQAGFNVLLHRQAPCNDGGLSLGQAVVAHFAAE